MADYSVGERNQIGRLRMSEANRRPLDSAGHDRAEEDRPPGLFSLVRGPIGLVVAGEGFEPSKAKPTDLQNGARDALTSDYASARTDQGPNRAPPSCGLGPEPADPGGCRWSSAVDGVAVALASTGDRG